MIILRNISAARCAISDRITITRGAKGKFRYDDKNYYDILVGISGPSTHNPAKAAKNLHKAYKHHVERIKYVEQLMNSYNPPSLISRIFHRMFQK